MVAGHENSGKTSFIKTVYHTADLKHIHFNDPERQADDSLSFIPDDVKFPTPIEARIEHQSGASERTLLRLIDTPGLVIPSKKQVVQLEEPTAFAQNWLKQICAFIESQYEATLLEESKVKRNPKSPDYQVHACLYLLDPSNVLAHNGLCEVDLLVLTKLCGILNVIPCLGKSDLLSSREIARAKKLVMGSIEKHEIGVQLFNDEEDDYSSDDGDSVSSSGSAPDVALSVKESLPFSLISGEEADETELEGQDSPRWTLERKFPWGTANIENPAHCDFLLLKDVVFGLYLQDLKDITRDVFYETWREEKLLQVFF